MHVYSVGHTHVYENIYKIEAHTSTLRYTHKEILYGTHSYQHTYGRKGDSSVKTETIQFPSNCYKS